MQVVFFQTVYLYAPDNLIPTLNRTRGTGRIQTLAAEYRIGICNQLRRPPSPSDAPLTPVKESSSDNEQR